MVELNRRIVSIVRLENQRVRERRGSERERESFRDGAGRSGPPSVGERLLKSIAAIGFAQNFVESHIPLKQRRGAIATKLCHRQMRVWQMNHPAAHGRILRIV